MSNRLYAVGRNRGRVLNHVFACGPVTRAALARDLELTRAAMTDLAGRLIDAGLLREHAGEYRGGFGRPGQLLRLRPDAAHFVGAEVGVERLVATVVDLGGAILARSETRGGGASPAEVFRRLIKLIESLRRRDSAAGVYGGLGVSIPGFMTRGGVVLSAPLLGWRNVDVVAALREHFEGPIIAENDANATAHGEWHFAPEPRGGDLLAVVLASGVGCGFISEGRILRGAHGFAGELGHIPMVVGETRDESWEARAGLDALGTGRDPGDWPLWVARGLAAAIYAYDPETIVIAGVLADAFAEQQAAIEAHLGRMLVSGFPLPALKVARFGGDGCAIGAASLVHARFLEQAEAAPQ
jgi:predicted NBD/HSP70 family sugar kinase